MFCKARWSLFVIFFLLLLIPLSRNAQAGLVLPQKHFYSFEQILSELHSWDLSKDSMGVFSFSFQDEDLSFSPSSVVSWCKSPMGNVTLKRKGNYSRLIIGNDIYRLNGMREKPGGDTIGKYWLAAVYETLYQFVAKGDTFTYFRAGYCPCNGSGCRFRFHFLVNHRLNSINIFETNDEQGTENLLADINGDSIPEFLLPFYPEDGYPLWTIKCPMQIIPYSQDSAGNYKPLLDSAGKEIHYRYYVDFEREGNRIFSKQ